MWTNKHDWLVIYKHNLFKSPFPGSLVLCLPHSLYHNKKRSNHISQDLTFLYLIGLPYRSSRPMQWAPHPNVCSKCPVGTHRPRLQSHVLCLWVVTSSWPHTCMIRCPRPSYKRGCFWPSQSVSLWLSSRPHHKVPSCDFPQAMPYALPPLDNSLHRSLSSLI